ncbi:MAG: SRPBCC family protein [Burkholderiales bacterium]|nr:SRPBCC family protein [Burkholderiales bacterium]
MNVVNVHQRLLYATPERVGALLDSLASPADALWPGRTWPRMKFDRPLGVGAAGGHGPIRYVVQAYAPGQSVRFRFTAPRGFEGWHGFEVLDATRAHCVLEHRIEMQARGAALLSWPLAICHLHDACVEDALSQAQAALGNTPKPVPWPLRVRLLHWLASRGVRPRTPPARSSHAR